MPATDRADFTFAVGSFGPGEFRVVQFHGTEGMSRLFEFTIDLASDEKSADFGAIVGENATFRWRVGDEERVINGIVCEFEQTGRGRDTSYYTAHLVPAVWSLGLRRQSRIFQGLSTKGILEKVLLDAKISADMFRFDLKRTYGPRNYCVQYRETDLAFLARMMEEEGITTFFEHKEDSHVLVMSDHTAATTEIDGDSTVAFREAGTGLEGDEEIVRFRFGRRLRTGAVTLRDWDFKKPANPIDVEKEAAGDAQFENYEYPGSYPNLSIGKEIVQVRLEQEQAERLAGNGAGNCRRFAAGFRFTIEDHPRAELNAEYLITRVAHSGSQPQAARTDFLGEADAPLYENSFECIPSDVPFRPRRATPVPRITGLQTAIVTGPSGEEIHCDKFGRVKVRFPWDRSGIVDDASSGWMRVSQQWGGSNWGSMFVPRVGQEVIVEFIEGDPNRPIITGRLYNGLNRPPYELPSMKTKSTIQTATTAGGAGGNELRFEDSAGGEEIFVNASKDMLVQVENDKKQTVGAQETTTIGANHAVTIGNSLAALIGKDEDQTVKGNDSLKVGSMQTILIGGSRTIGIEGSKSETVGSASIETVLAERSVTVGGSYTETVAALAIELVRGDKSTEIGGKNSRTSLGEIATVKGKKNLSVSSDQQTMIGGALMAKVKGNWKIDAKGAATFISAFMKIESKTKITLSCGDSELVIDGSGIAIKTGSLTIIGATVKLAGSGSKAN